MHNMVMGLFTVHAQYLFKVQARYLFMVHAWGYLLTARSILSHGACSVLFTVHGTDVFYFSDHLLFTDMSLLSSTFLPTTCTLNKTGREDVF